MHEIQVLIGRPEPARALADELELRSVSLPQNLVLLPLPIDQARRVIGDESFDWPDLENKSPTVDEKLGPLLARLKELVRSGGLLLVLTQYFGGWGQQASCFLDDGAIAYGPVIGSDLVNEGLRRLGVRTADKKR